MAGYLDQYGAGDERRIKIIKTLVVLGGVAFFVFHNFQQERQVTRFLERLQAKDYQGAYEFWVAGETDRKGYPFESFLQDWGPGSGHGVILTVDFANGKQEKLWVQRENLVVGFSPLPGCPAPR